MFNFRYFSKSRYGKKYTKNQLIYSTCRYLQANIRKRASIFPSPPKPQKPFPSFLNGSFLSYTRGKKEETNGKEVKTGGGRKRNRDDEEERRWGWVKITRSSAAASSSTLPNKKTAAREKKICQTLSSRGKHSVCPYLFHGRADAILYKSAISIPPQGLHAWRKCIRLDVSY